MWCAVLDPFSSQDHSFLGLVKLSGPLPSSKNPHFQNEARCQRAKKVVSDSPGLVDFAIGLVNSVLNLPDGQVKIFRRIKITEVL